MPRTGARRNTPDGCRREALADLVRQHRSQHRSRWRRLAPSRQALLALAHLRNGDTYIRLAAGFEIGVAAAWRYVQEAIALLAAAVDDLTTAMDRIRKLAYAILDGTLIPIDRVADSEAVLLRKAQEARREYAGHRGCLWPARMGIAGTARLGARPERCPHSRHHRRADQRKT